MTEQEPGKPPSLRDLARQIETVAREHPCYSQAYDAVRSVCEFLESRARVEELNRIEGTPRQHLTFFYKNWHGRIDERHVHTHSYRWGTSEFYPTPTWLMMAWDKDKKDFREFNIANIWDVRTTK